MNVSKESSQLSDELRRASARISEQNSELKRQLSQASSRLKEAGFDLGLENPAVRAMQQTMQAQNALLPRNTVLDTLQRETQILEMLSPVNQAAESLRQIMAPYDKALNQIAQQFEFRERELDRVLAPYRTVLASLSEATVLKQMEALRKSWILPNFPQQSITGFAHLSCLSEVAHAEDPFSKEASELVASELGSGVQGHLYGDTDDRDTAAIEAGLNPDLIAFPPSEYSEVLWEAGFKFYLSTPMPIPQAIEPVEGAVFDSKCWRLMAEVEQRLRSIIETALNKQAGSGWVKRRVSESVRKRWKERQEEDRVNGRTVYALIQYADFMDLADVVSQSDNWREVFEPVFRNREDFVVSLRRLHLVRKAIAHNRPLSRYDVLTLANEATRILTALGIRILH